jgi:hypothetical protein
MNDKPNVRLIDTKTKCVRRNHQWSLAAHETLLGFLAFALAQLAVISLARHVLVAKPRVNLLHSLDRGRINDAAALMGSDDLE